MTLDQLIVRAAEIRSQHGGDIEVGCSPCDGPVIRADHLKGVTLDLYEDVLVFVDGYPDYPAETRTFLMFDHGPE